MSNLFTTLVESCARLVRSCVLALVGYDSQPRPSTSTSSPTHTTGSGTSARSATKLNVVSRSPRLSEQQATHAADQLVSQWRGTEDGSDEDLKRLLASSILSLTDRAAHLGSVATMSEVMFAASQLPEDSERVHLHLAEQTAVANALLTALDDVDAYLLLVASSINELLEYVEDVDVSQHLRQLRESVMMADEYVRETMERYERSE